MKTKTFECLRSVQPEVPSNKKGTKTEQFGVEIKVKGFHVKALYFGM
jgi:hypothetical protein